MVEVNNLLISADAIRVRLRELGITIDTNELVPLGLVFSILNNNEPYKTPISIRFQYEPKITEILNIDGQQIFLCADIINCYNSVEELDPALNKYLEINNYHIKTYKTKEKSATIITLNDSISADFVYILLGFAPKLLPDLFNQQSIVKHQKFLTQLNSLCKDCKYNSIDELLIKLANIDIKKMQEESLKLLLKENMVFNIKSRKEALERQATKLRNQASSLLQDYNFIIRQLNDINYQIAADPDPDQYKGVIDYFVHTPAIHIDSVGTSNGTITYDVVSYLSQYDIDEYMLHTDKFTKPVYGSIPTEKQARYKKLFDLIFIERKYKIKVASSYRLVIDGIGRIEVCGNTNRDDLIKKYGPLLLSPHMEYNCAGTFPSEWNNALQNNDYISAINYTIALASSISWHDSPVVNKFGQMIQGHKCIEDNGKYYTGNEMIERLGL